MRFSYERYEGPDGLTIERPVIPITLYNPNSSNHRRSATTHSSTSGADYCVFSAEIADMLGLDIAAGEQQAMSSVFVGDERSVRLPSY